MRHSSSNYILLFFGIALGLFFVSACNTPTPQKPLKMNNGLAIEAPNLPNSEKLFPISQKILNTYVNSGVVDYKKIQSDSDFPKALEEISHINPENLKTKNEKLAFWINVYNLFTINAIIEKYPIQSINELHFMGSLSLAYVLNRTIWDTYYFEIHNRKYNLNQVEHDILRKEFKDFRIHAAIVCAAKSCPPLRSEIYHPKFIDEQLDNQMKIFLSQRHKNYYDSKHNILYLSKIFDWFEKDFKSDDRSLIQNLERFFPQEWREDVIRNNPKISFTDYDWSLNEK